MYFMDVNIRGVVLFEGRRMGDKSCVYAWDWSVHKETWELETSRIIVVLPKYNAGGLFRFCQLVGVMITYCSRAHRVVLGIEENLPLPVKLGALIEKDILINSQNSLLLDLQLKQQA